MIEESRLRRMHYRAWHRGTKEADLLIGGYCDTFAAGWTNVQADWFEDLLAEEDHDIMAWALGREEPPGRFAGAMMDALQRLDFIPIEK